MAELMKNKGEIVAWDVHLHRVKLVEENAKRLGISIIETKEKNALVYEPKYEGTFDKVLLDVPCMGIGVLKRKPDIKWQKKEENIIEIRKIQEEILKIGIRYLKPRGELVYSTCSILKEENEEVIEKVLNAIKAERSGLENLFEVIEQKNILPDENTDGFFICKIRKCR